MYIDFRELREQLTDETIKAILSQFKVEPVSEDEEKIVFPTCCHNLEGGSPKLWYYKSSKLFHCWTECQTTFDIFTLLQKMYRLRGKEISLLQAIGICDLDGSIDGGGKITNEEIEQYHRNSCANDIRYMQELNNTYIPDIDKLDFKEYDASVLHNYSFDYMGLMPWISEGIGIDVLQRFNIKYDSSKNAILIPNFDYGGKLIGIRARYFSPEEVAKGKYRPFYLNKMWYSHPTGRTFYGIYENHKNIEKKHIAVIFEGEKSVLKYGTIYGNDQNIALATLGQNITKDHIQYLLKMGVRHVILAYDTDYEDDGPQMREVESKYIKKAEILSPYFNVSILMDYDLDLPYKSSPIDGGKETFEKILQNRRIV